MTDNAYLESTREPMIRLTGVEEELMMILWQHGPSTVKEVMQHLPSQRHLAYTSVSTTLRILQSKHIVMATKQGRGHLYAPTYTLEEYKKTTVYKAIHSLFLGNMIKFIHYLIADFDLSSSEIDALIQRLEAKKFPE